MSGPIKDGMRLPALDKSFPKAVTPAPPSVRTKMRGWNRRSSHVHQDPSEDEEIGRKFETVAMHFHVFKKSREIP